MSAVLLPKIYCVLSALSDDGGIGCRFTGLNPSQVQALVAKAHIYMTGNGRISMA